MISGRLVASRVVELRRHPISAQFGVLVTLAVLLGIAAIYQIGSAIRVAEAHRQARAVADMVDSFGIWATRYRGVWIRADQAPSSVQQIGDYLEREPIMRLGGVPEGVRAGPPHVQERGAFHRKNPELVQRELAQVMATSTSQVRFRTTSDKYMNPENAPNEFEQRAIERLRESQDLEWSEVAKGQLLYARKLMVAETCLSCHESAAKAPETVRIKFPGPQGYGYRAGEIAGVISIAVPLRSGFLAVVADLGPAAWLTVLGFLSASTTLLIFVRRGVIQPIHALHSYADHVARSKLGTEIEKPRFDRHEHSSDNEIHRLSAAIGALHQSIRILRRGELVSADSPGRQAQRP